MKKIIPLILFFMLFLQSCWIKKRPATIRKKNIEFSEPKPVVTNTVNEREFIKKLVKKNPNLNKYTLAYIEKFAAIAVQEMHEYKIPASITLAQGILESGRGRSELALKSNNHFGIKCHTGWQGEKVYHDDDEKGECFRKYNYPETSYKDHSLFLTQRKRYAFLFEYDLKDFKKWAYGLRKAGYATDKKYPVKLLNLIKTYHLYEFDAIKKDSSFRKRKNSSSKKYNTSKKQRKKLPKTHTVQKGETLYFISKKYGVSIKLLQELNNLPNTILTIGQQLVLQ